MGRGTLIAVLGAAVVGSTGGGLAALWSSQPPLAPPPPAPPAAAPAPSAPSPAAVAPASPRSASRDPNAALAAQMRIVLARFVEWSRDRAGAPCPDVTALGVAAVDPWGHAIDLTCTDQPADQMVGAVSAGPDGVVGNDDDVTSWNLGREVTELVHGARWKSTPSGMAAHPVTRPAKRRKDGPALHERSAGPAALPAPPAPGLEGTSAAPPPPPAPARPPAAVDAGGDDIPSRR